jgi:plastocyanin
MKKLAVLLVMLLAAVALAACGGGSDTTNEGTSPAAGAVEEAEETAEEAGEEAENAGEEAGEEAEGGTAGTASAVEIEADPEGSLAFTSDSASAKAGKVTVDFTNSSPVPHDVTIEGKGGETLAQTEVFAEGSESVSANLKPGTYTFYCSVPGHREAGMEGTLTVK